MKYLIAKGMDPNCIDKKGKTAQLGCFWLGAEGSIFVLACCLVVGGGVFRLDKPEIGPTGQFSVIAPSEAKTQGIQAEAQSTPPLH